MSRTYLLELSEAEIETLDQRLKIQRDILSESIPEIMDRTYIEKQISYCNSVISKIQKAQEKQVDELITFKDLNHIVSVAKDQYKEIPNDLYISDNHVENKVFPHIALANSFIGWLNSKNLLKRLPKFDYTDNSNQFEEIGD